MTWQLSIIDLELRGHGYKVNLSAIRDTRSLWSLLTEAAGADLDDEALAGLIRLLVKILPPSELVFRASLLDRLGLQIIIAASACREDRPKRRNHRERYVTEEAP